MKKLLIVMLLMLPSLALADKVQVRCTSGNTDVFNKPVDSIEYMDNGIIVYIGKTRYRIINAACLITDTIL